MKRLIMLLTALGLTEENKETSEWAMFTADETRVEEWQNFFYLWICGLFSLCKAFHGCVKISEAHFPQSEPKAFLSITESNSLKK